jgi:hypothetical protein
LIKPHKRQRTAMRRYRTQEVVDSGQIPSAQAHIRAGYHPLFGVTDS